MKRPLAVIFTSWLIAQILLPFTPPFPVCDLSDLLGSSHQQSDRIPASPSDAPPANAAYAFAPPLVTSAGHLKLVVVSLLDAIDVVTVPPLALAGRSVGSAVLRPQSRQVLQTPLRL